MIRVLSSFAIIISLFCVTVAEAKVGVAPLQQLVMQSDMGIEGDRVIQEKFGAENKRLEDEFAKFNKDAEAFSKQAQALSEQARMEKAQNLDTTMRELEVKRNNFMKSMAPVQQKINDQISEVLAEAVKSYAKKNGYSVIIEASAVLHADDDVFLYEGILSEVNKIWKDKGGKFKLN